MSKATVFVSNGEVYIADTLNHRVRKVLRNGKIVTIVGTEGYNGDGQLATTEDVFNSSSTCNCLSITFWLIVVVFASPW